MVEHSIMKAEVICLKCKHLWEGYFNQSVVKEADEIAVNHHKETGHTVHVLLNLRKTIKGEDDGEM